MKFLVLQSIDRLLDAWDRAIATLKRRIFRRPLINPAALGRELTDRERIQNLSRNLYGDDRLLGP